LVGNPYPCVIDWNAASGWTKTGLDNAIYFWDQKNNRFASYVAGIGVNGGTRYIPAMQAFYVVVSTPGGTGTLAMNNNVRTTANNPDVWRVASQEKIIRLKADNGAFNDETVIRLSEYATEQFDNHLDAHKIPSGGTTPSISTKLGAVNYMVNSIPDTTAQKTIPVPVIAAASGTYTISADINGFDRSDSIVLEDIKLGVSQDLTANPNYVATLVKGDTATRFFIHYKKATKTSFVTDNYDQTENEGLNIFAAQQNVYIQFGSQNISSADVAVYDITGQKVYDIQNADASSGKIEVNLNQVNTGIYIVKVQSNNLNKTQQVYITR